MQGRAFLDAARQLLPGGTEPCWRAAAGEAYYGLMLECRDALFRWGFTMPRRDTVHSWVRLRFIYSGDADLRTIGTALEDLGSLRNRSRYDLRTQPEFTSATRAVLALQQATDALALLDAIDADPVRQAAARAAIRP